MNDINFAWSLKRNSLSVPIEEFETMTLTGNFDLYCNIYEAS